MKELQITDEGFPLMQDFLHLCALSTNQNSLTALYSLSLHKDIKDTGNDNSIPGSYTKQVEGIWIIYENNAISQPWSRDRSQDHLSQSQTEDSGFYFKTGQDHKCSDITKLFLYLLHLFYVGVVQGIWIF